MAVLANSRTKHHFKSSPCGEALAGCAPNGAQQNIPQDLFTRRYMPLTTEDIQRITAEQYGITVSDMLGRTKPDNIVFPRQVSMAMVRRKLGLSYPHIGKLFGRTHGAVMHAVKAVENRSESYPDTRKRLEQLSADLDLIG